jgi:hypothetical protein
VKIGTTTIPLAGWGVDPRRPEEGRARRLAAILENNSKAGVEESLGRVRTFL